MHKIDYLNDIEGTRKLALWHARPWTYRLRYRYNVLWGLLRRQITLKSCWNALENSYTIAVVPMKAPHRGMLIVCPEFAEGYFQMNRSAQSGGLEKAPDELDQLD
ncbi:hypothetical protein KW830_04410 [Comamonas sp. CMM03]|jgi:hypothetical protein|uniref:hypothetical protein n=1 Tax=Comamonas sp. CMM03 TaxID=2854781 RepID=UPI001C47992F|nr:hypothetical protein [Comamonas sp. CMM03]MBV7417690.1 hypothetical protein [Comamonas sp. CMM03]